MGEGSGNGEAAIADSADARRVKLVDADETVESSGSSTTSHVCKVASGANETLRFAAQISEAPIGHIRIRGSLLTIPL